MVRVLCISLSLSLIGLVGCSESSSSDLVFSNLPAVTSLVKSNSGSISDLLGVASLDMHAASGTPLPLDQITDDLAKAGAWGSIVDSIRATTATDAEKAQFFGTVDTGVGGEGGCRMVQNVGLAFEHIESASRRSCIIRELSERTTSVLTDDAGNANLNTLFQSPSGSDTTIKINLDTTDDEGNTTQEDAFIRIRDQQETEGNYVIQMWFCEQGGSSPLSVQTVTINETEKTYSTTFVASENSTLSTFTINTNYTDEEGNLVWDISQDRTFTGHFSTATSIFKVNLVADSNDRMTTKARNSWNFSDDNCPAGGCVGTDDNFTVVNFNGTTLQDLRIVQGGFKGQGTDSDDTWDYEGASEFQTTAYVSAASSEFTSLVSDMTFSEDTFYDGTLENPDISIDAETFPCDLQTQYELSLQESTKVTNIFSRCEPELSNMDFCNTPEVISAREEVN